MKPNLSSIFCLTVIILSMLLPGIPSANALSGSWTKEFISNYGKSSYTLVLTSPDEVSSSSNWSITVSFIIDNMDKWKTFVFYSNILIRVETGNGKLLSEFVQFGSYPISEFPNRLYPGARWGPNNVTFNLAEEDLELPLGGSMNADIFVTVNLAEYVYQPFVLDPIHSLIMVTEDFSLHAGTVNIISERNIFASYIPYIIGLAASAIIFIGLIVRGRFANRPPR